MNRHLLFTLLIGIFLTGCALGPIPKNAKEYRAAILEGGFGTNYESYVVRQPYWKVAKTVKAKTKRCLDQTIKSTTCGGIYGGSCNTKTFDYNPRFIKGKKKSELHVQVIMSNSLPSISVGEKPPKNGMYIAVIDFIKKGKNKTKINVYSPSMGFTAIPKAVKHWSNQTNLGCPDFSDGL